MIHLVGDVQGCADALDRLLAEIGFSPSRDRIVVLGDLVNRGPGSLAVLKRLAALGDAATCLLGNHDLHLLAVAHGVRPLHRSDTFGDVLAARDRTAWVDWLRRLPLAVLESGWLCVHAGVLPQWDTAQTLALATELQSLLAGPELAAFLPQMYGNDPRRWDESLQGADRWRLVINTLTRARFCSGNGSLDFKLKGDRSSAPAGLMPWFEVPARRTAGQAIAFGHWSTLGLIDSPQLLAIDTGCVWGGALTAVRVDGGRREVVQLPCPQAQRLGSD
jgi:bis(5'-nucleosyl)-tetraphosphatase (symmetrical)